MLWVDLRGTEARRLRELVDQAVSRAHDRAIAAVVKELTAAGVQFAAEHPDVPATAAIAPRGSLTPRPGSLRVGSGTVLSRSPGSRPMWRAHSG